MQGNQLTLELTNYDDGTGYGVFNGGPAIQGDGLWHHVAGVRDESGKIYFYIDGEQFHDAADVSLQNLSNTEKLEIGTFWTEAFNGETFKGGIDDVRIYKTAVSAEWIRQLAGCAIEPQPLDGAAGVSIWPELSWTSGVGVLSYDIYFGTDNPPLTLAADDHLSTIWQPGQLESGAAYYWQVNENLASGTKEGEVWEFTTTEKYQAHYLYPSDGQSLVQVNSFLYWIPGAGAVSHDVYFGADYPPVTQIADDIVENYIDPCSIALDLNTIYYWRVDENTDNGTVSGDVWQFTTFCWGGGGTKADPYRIGTMEELEALSRNYPFVGYFYYFVLTDDITIPPGLFIDPIGNSSKSFNSVFDGKGHTITGLNQSGASYLGLFGKTSGSARISNLTIADAYIDGTGAYIGILVGYNDAAITNCRVVAGVVNGNTFLGGLVGGNFGSISNCYATGAVTGGSLSCYIGGLVGYNSQGTISNSYATGAISGTYSLGGLVGYLSSGSIMECYWDITTSELTDGVGNVYPDPVGAIGKSTVDMKLQATFGGWDFGNVWKIVENRSYPYQDIMAGVAPEIPGDINGDGIVNLLDWAILAGHWLDDIR